MADDESTSESSSGDGDSSYVGSLTATPNPENRQPFSRQTRQQASAKETQQEEPRMALRKDPQATALYNPADDNSSRKSTTKDKENAAKNEAKKKQKLQQMAQKAATTVFYNQIDTVSANDISPVPPSKLAADEFDRVYREMEEKYFGSRRRSALDGNEKTRPKWKNPDSSDYEDGDGDGDGEEVEGEDGEEEEEYGGGRGGGGGGGGSGSGGGGSGDPLEPRPSSQAASAFAEALAAAAQEVRQALGIRERNLSGRPVIRLNRAKEYSTGWLQDRRNKRNERRDKAQGLPNYDPLRAETLERALATDIKNHRMEAMKNTLNVTNESGVTKMKSDDLMEETVQAALNPWSTQEDVSKALTMSKLVELLSTTHAVDSGGNQRVHTSFPTPVGEIDLSKPIELSSFNSDHPFSTINGKITCTTSCLCIN